MTLTPILRTVLRLGLLAVVLLGCSRRSARPTALPCKVKGIVTQDGRPLESGAVTFMPTVSEEEGGRPGVARIESGGRFLIGNANASKPPGLLPGRYRVTVLQVLAQRSPAGSPRLKTVSPPGPSNLLTTPFVVDIEPGSSHVTIDLARESISVSHE